MTMTNNTFIIILGITLLIFLPTESHGNRRRLPSHEAGNWGVEVTGVEIRQVIIPQELEAAMSMQAQAEREKSARITYGESEIQVAQRFVDASKIYADSPMAYALRQSNMLYESMKIQGNTIIMVPSETLNSMGFGNLGMTIGYLENVKKAITKAGIRGSSPHAHFRQIQMKEYNNQNKEDM